jgi:hypothetical protein
MIVPAGRGIVCLCVMMIWRNYNDVNTELTSTRPRKVCSSPSLLVWRWNIHCIFSSTLQERNHLGGEVKDSSCIFLVCRWLSPVLVLVVDWRGWRSKIDNLDDDQHRTRWGDSLAKQSSSEICKNKHLVTRERVMDLSARARHGLHCWLIFTTGKARARESTKKKKGLAPLSFFFSRELANELPVVCVSFEGTGKLPEQTLPI